MKLAIYNKEAKKVGDVELDLKSDIRDDLYKKAILAEQSIFTQEKGADPEAGKKNSITVSKRRRKFRTTYGRGGSRTPKKAMWRRGTQVRFVGAFAPNTVGGRKAHAPTADKNLIKHVNNKEWLAALKVGVMSSFTPELVKANGQAVPQNYPLVLDDSIENITKTKEFTGILEKLGFGDEMTRVSVRKVRAGKGTMRGRTYKDKRGPLVVVSSFESPLLKASRNVKSFDVITPELLMVSDFGMSHRPGRIVLFTQKAMEEFKEAMN